MRITILVDDAPGGPGLASEHGLSIHVQFKEWSLLLDTGQSASVLESNAARLGVDLTSLDAVVLSHGHYDHTGGCRWVLGASPSARLYLHPCALAPRYRRPKDAPPRAIGMPPACVEAVRQATHRVVWTESRTELFDGVWVTGPIPRVTHFEDTGGAFYLDPHGETADPLQDDQALWLDTDAGPVVLVGCAHAGVINTLAYVSTLGGAWRIHAVIGGMHLLGANSSRLQGTAGGLGAYGVRLVAPCHCTGGKATVFLKDAFAAGCRAGHVGLALDL